MEDNISSPFRNVNKFHFYIDKLQSIGTKNDQGWKNEASPHPATMLILGYNVYINVSKTQLTELDKKKKTIWLDTIVPPNPLVKRGIIPFLGVYRLHYNYGWTR